MFGMGMWEIVIIAIVALLVVGPDHLPAAAKAIGKGIRDLRQQSKDLTNTIENDTEIGSAVKELRHALQGNPATLYKAATGEDFPKLSLDSDDETSALDEPPQLPADTSKPLDDGASTTEAIDSEAEGDTDLPVIRTVTDATPRSIEPAPLSERELSAPNTPQKDPADDA